MPTDVDQTASSADAPAIPDLASLTSEQRSSWRKTGEFSTQDAHADSSPAEPVEQVASTDASTPAASDTAKTEKPKGEGLKKRLPELDADIARLEEKLRRRAELARQIEEPARAASDVKSGSSPKPPVGEFIESPDVTRPRLTESQFFEAYPEAQYELFQDYIANYRLQSVEHKRSQTQYQQQAEQVNPVLKD